MKFIATTSDKVNSIDVVSGQLIFSRDDSVIYLDTDTRTAFHTIIKIATDAQRRSLISPVQGFYFVEETAVLWNFQNGYWHALTQEPDEYLVFIGEDETKPVTGEVNKLYIHKRMIYQYNTDTHKYETIASPEWEAIV